MSAHEENLDGVSLQLVYRSRFPAQFNAHAAAMLAALRVAES